MCMTRSTWGCGERWIARMACHPIPWRHGEEVTHHSASSMSHRPKVCEIDAEEAVDVKAGFDYTS